jgi:excisionase family DNA binding protein
MTKDSSAWLSPKQAAPALQVSVGTLYRWIKDGIIRARQPRGPRGRLRISACEIKRLQEREAVE